MIIKMPSHIDRESRRVALGLLARGIARPHEVAELAGVSLQVVNYWMQSAGVDWQRTRRRMLARAWRKGMRHGPKITEQSPGE